MDGSIPEEFRPGPLLLDGILNTHKPDILDTISNLSNDEVFTPPLLANQVLDLLPTEIWSDPEIRILDPFCKTGVFLREAARRLIVGLADVIPDEAERRAHIFRNQLFGVAITELTWLMSRRSLYGTKDASSDIAAHLTTRMDRPEGNIIFPHRTHDFDARGRCRVCGIGRDIERQGRDNHAYALIHGGLEEEFGDMQFEVIIGNPPYQVKSGGYGAQATPIYNHFLDEAKKINSRFLSMIIPARWYAGGMGLDEFRVSMLTDPEITHLVDIPKMSDVFPGVDFEGGICYFVREKGRNGEGCAISNQRDGIISPPTIRKLDAQDVFIRDNQSISIVEKVLQRHTGGWLSDKVSSVNPFGLSTNFSDYSDQWFENSVKLYARGKEGWIDRGCVQDRQGWVDKIKVIIGMAYGERGKAPYNVISRPAILNSKSCCTMTYLVVNVCEDISQANSLVAYLRTKFVRFLISLKKNTQHLSRSKFSFVPDLPMSETWTDERLYNLFGITDEDQVFINSMIREM